MDHPVTDLALARRLERAEAAANAAFCLSRAARQPHSGATWQDFDGTWAMFDGVNSPLTQSFGLGLFAPASPAHLDAVDAFFESRGADAMHEVSAIAFTEDGELLRRLHERGLRVVELSAVLCRPIGAVPAARTSRAVARRITAGEESQWASTSAEGWRELPGLGDFMRDLGLVLAHADGAHPFLAEIEGIAVGTGALSIHDGVALLAGASTVPEHRGQGAQSELLQSRLRHAASLGCDLAMMVAQPGSASHRNAERQGFRVAYGRMKWGR